MERRTEIEGPGPVGSPRRGREGEQQQADHDGGRGRSGLGAEAEQERGRDEQRADGVLDKAVHERRARALVQQGPYPPAVSGSRGAPCAGGQRGQNFFSSSRSGSLRRFFLVM